MKLWLARNGSLVDAGKNIDEGKKDDESVKVFGNVGSGRVIPQDRIVALTEELFEFFSKENFLQTVVQFNAEKQFKNIFKSKEKAMSTLSGILLFTLVGAMQASGENGPSSASWRIRASNLGLRVPSLVTFPKITLPSLLKGPPKLSFAFPSSIRKRLSFASSFEISGLRKRIGLLMLLVFVLFVGFALFGAEQNRRKDAREVLQDQEKMAEESRILNKIIDIPNPEVVAEFSETFLAENFQRMTQIDGKFYFFGASSKNISLFDSQAQTFDGSIFQSSLADFPKDFQLAAMEQFAENRYFLDSRTGEILKSSLSGSKKGVLEAWLDPLSSQKPNNAQSMSIDGSVWILGEGNEISRYYKGRYQETLNPIISPALQNAVSLKTGAQIPYLYILDPSEQRLVVLAKSGQLIQQYRSASFAHVRDFAVLPNGLMIYLFDEAKLYKISPILTQP